MIILNKSDIRETIERIDARKSRDRGKVVVMNFRGGYPTPHLVTKHFFLDTKSTPTKVYFFSTKERLINGK